MDSVVFKVRDSLPQPRRTDVVLDSAYSWHRLWPRTGHLKYVLHHLIHDQANASKNHLDVKGPRPDGAARSATPRREPVVLGS